MLLALLVLGPTQEGPDPCEQLTQGKGLGQVIVGPRIQAATGRRLATGRSHQDRRAVTALAQPPADLQAVEAGHCDVEDHGLIGRGPEFSRASWPSTAWETS